MLQILLSASEFTTKLIAGLSGVIFAVIILIVAIHAKNRVKPEDSPAELKRKAKQQNDEIEQNAQNKKNKKKKQTEEIIEDDEQQVENE